MYILQDRVKTGIEETVAGEKKDLPGRSRPVKGGVVILGVGHVIGGVIIPGVGHMTGGVTCL